MDPSLLDAYLTNWINDTNVLLSLTLHGRIVGYHGDDLHTTVDDMHWTSSIKERAHALIDERTNEGV